MLLEQNVTIKVFEITNDTFKPLGEIDEYKSLQWSEKYQDFGTFELWLPINEKTKELIKKDNVLWLGDDYAGVIEIINPQTENSNIKVYNVKGRTIECFLQRRIVWGTFNAYEISDIADSIQKMVDQNFVSLTPSQINAGMLYRKMPWMAVDNTFRSGILKAFQTSYTNVYEKVQDICVENDLGFRLRFDPVNKQYVFEVYKGLDRTYTNVEGNKKIVFDTETEDLLSSNYYTSNQDYKNVGLALGEGTGFSRSSVIVGQETVDGIERRELYVDARDVQSTYMDDTGVERTLTEEEYIKALTQKGSENLAEYEIVESFEGIIRTVGNVNYQYGVDYSLGDKVTIIDRDLNLILDAQIMAKEDVWADTYTMNLTFGFTRPTILQKMRMMIK